MSDYGLELGMVFNFLAIICIIVWAIFGFVLYKIFKHPRVNKKFFALTLGIIFGPVIYVSCLFVAAGASIMVFTTFLLMLPFFMLVLVSLGIGGCAHLIVYYCASFALLIAAYFWSRRKNTNQGEPIGTIHDK